VEAEGGQALDSAYDEQPWIVRARDEISLQFLVTPMI